MFRVDSEGTANEVVIIDSSTRQKPWQAKPLDADGEIRRAIRSSDSRLLGGWAIKYSDMESGRETWYRNPTSEEVEHSDYFIDEMGNAYDPKTGHPIEAPE